MSRTCDRTGSKLTADRLTKVFLLSFLLAV